MILKHKLNLKLLALLIVISSITFYSSVYCEVITYRGGAGGKLEIFSMFSIVVTFFLLVILSFLLLIETFKEKQWYTPMYLFFFPLVFLPFLLFFYSSPHSNDILEEHLLFIIGSIFFGIFFIRISLRGKREKLLSMILFGLVVLYSIIIVIIETCFNYYGDSISIVIYRWYAYLTATMISISFIPCFIAWLILYIRNWIKDLETNG